MRNSRTSFLMLVIVAGIFSLTACGGGGGNPAGPDPVPTSTPSAPPPDPITVNVTVPAGSSLTDVKALQGGGRNTRPECRNVKIALEGVPWTARLADGLAAWGLNSDPNGGEARCGTIRFVADAATTGERAGITKYGKDACTVAEATVWINPISIQNGEFHLVHGVGHAAYGFGHPANGRDSTGPFVMSNIDGSAAPLVPNGTEQWFADAHFAHPTCTTFNIVQ